MATQSKVLRVRAECGEAWSGRARSLRAWSGREDSFTRRQTRLSKLLVAILVVAGANVGLLGVAAGPASAAVVFSQHPDRGLEHERPGARGARSSATPSTSAATSARCAGPAARPSSPATNLFAIDRNTGALIPGFVGVHERHRSRASSPTARTSTSAAASPPSTTRAAASSPSLDPVTGALRAVQPEPAEPGLRHRRSAATRLYLGGVFNAIGGTPRSRVALVDKTTGVLDPTFNPTPDGDVRTLAFSPDGRAHLRRRRLPEHRRGRAAVPRRARPDHRRRASRSSSSSSPAPPLDLDVDPTVRASTPRSAASPVPATAPIAWNANTGVRLWRNEADG